MGSIIDLWPAVLAGAFGAFVPKRPSWGERAAIGLIAALLVLFLMWMWPDAAGAIEETPTEWPHLLNLLIGLPLVGSLFILFSAVCAGIMALVAVLTLIGWRKAESTRARALSVRRENRDLRGKIARIPGLARSVTTLRSAYEESLDKIPTQPHQAAVLDSLYKLFITQLIHIDRVVIHYRLPIGDIGFQYNGWSFRSMHRGS